MTRKIPLTGWFGVIFAFGSIIAFTPRVYEGSHDGLVGVLVRLAEGLGEALIIASVLGVVVDRYAKMKLATEVGETIAAKIHGYHLPDDLRDAINQVNDFKFVWSKVEWDIDMFQTDANDGCLRWRSTLSYEIINITSVEQGFVHTAAITSASGFDAADSAKIVRVAHELNDVEQYHYDGEDDEFKNGLKLTDTRLAWQNKCEIRIPPWNKFEPSPKRYRFFNTVEKIVAENDLRSLFFSYPAIGGVRLTIDTPAGFEVVTSLDSDNIKPRRPYTSETGWEWYTKSVYLNNQRVSVRHRRALAKAHVCPIPEQAVNADRTPAVPTVYEETPTTRATPRDDSPVGP
jgi:hypothetical protein